MKKKNIIRLVVFLIVLFGVLILVRTFVPEFTCTRWPFCNKKVEQTQATTTLANPASVHCEEVGGTLEIKTDASGGQVGFCTLPDKSVCEEWTLLRNECLENSEHFLHLNIKAGDTITSPLKITGESGGGWFFEGSFPITLVDWDGRIITEGIAQSKADWMTTNFVPFEAELKFIKPANPTNQNYASKGAIIFKKDNPSGLPQNDAAYELPIKY